MNSNNKDEDLYILTEQICHIKPQNTEESRLGLSANLQRVGGGGGDKRHKSHASERESDKAQRMRRGCAIRES